MIRETVAPIKKHIIKPGYDVIALLYQKYLCDSIYWPGAARGSISPAGNTMIFLSHFKGSHFEKSQINQEEEGRGEGEEVDFPLCIAASLLEPLSGNAVND